jgi:magnesium-transporting ATPase (P-type)
MSLFGPQPPPISSMANSDFISRNGNTIAFVMSLIYTLPFLYMLISNYIDNPSTDNGKEDRIRLMKGNGIGFAISFVYVLINYKIYSYYKNKLNEIKSESSDYTSTYKNMNFWVGNFALTPIYIVLIGIFIIAIGSSRGGLFR